MEDVHFPGERFKSISILGHGLEPSGLPSDRDRVIRRYSVGEQGIVYFIGHGAPPGYTNWLHEPFNLRMWIDSECVIEERVFSRVFSKKAHAESSYLKGTLLADPLIHLTPFGGTVLADIRSLNVGFVPHCGEDFESLKYSLLPEIRDRRGNRCKRIRSPDGTDEIWFVCGRHRSVAARFIRDADTGFIRSSMLVDGFIKVSDLDYVPRIISTYSHTNDGESKLLARLVMDDVATDENILDSVFAPTIPSGSLYLSKSNLPRQVVAGGSEVICEMAEFFRPRFSNSTRSVRRLGLLWMLGICLTIACLRVALLFGFGGIVRRQFERNFSDKERSPHKRF